MTPFNRPPFDRLHVGHSAAFLGCVLLCAAVVLTRMGCKCSPTGPHPGPDTTSHAFTWQVTTLGDGQSSILYDVAIINDTLAYAVGEIYVKDSSGAWINPPCNVAIWNGRDWRTHTLTYLGGYAPITAVFAFGKDDIWFGMGYALHWDGTSYKEVEITGFHSKVNRIWGSSSADLYVVGNGGEIRHYDGTSWTKITSGTTLPFQDIWGAVRSGQSTQVLAVASNLADVPSGKIIVQIQGSSALQLPDSGLSTYLRGVWFVPGQQYYVAGGGIHWKKDAGSIAPWSKYPNGQVTSKASQAIRANGLNDIVVVGSFGEIVHFNGSTWRSYWDQIPEQSGSFYGVAMKGDLIIAVGTLGNVSRVAVGRR